MSPEDTDYLIQPNNQEAEQQIIAILLNDNTNLDYVIDILFPFHFYNDINAQIYKTIKKIVLRNDEATPISIPEEFPQKEQKKIRNYLILLYKEAISLDGISTYSTIVINNYKKRQLIKIAQEIIDGAKNNKEVEALINTAESQLYDISIDRDCSRLIPLGELTQKTIKNIEARKNNNNCIGVTTGFKDLDIATGGLAPSELIIIASRPSMGKTALATNIAINAAKTGFKVVFFSLEMSSEEIISRIIANETGISSERIRNGSICIEDIYKIQKSAEILNALPIYIDESTNIEISSIRARIRQFKRKYGIDLLVIDYLQLLRDSSVRENRTQELSIITRYLKLIAKELNIPIIALSQLSRAVEARSDKRPLLSDLRESGSIEQDADIVLFLYREEYYLSRCEPSDPDEYQEWLSKLAKAHNRAEVICAKHRHGAIGTTNLTFNSKICKFGDFNLKPDFL